MNDNDKSDPYVMYFVVRESLGMSAPKLAGQIGHGVQALFVDHGRIHPEQINRDFYNPHGDQEVVRFMTAFAHWASDTFSRKVLLGADEKEWVKVKALHEETKHSYLIVDKGLTELQPNTETVIAFAPMLKSEAPKLLRRLQLLR